MKVLVDSSVWCEYLGHDSFGVAEQIIQLLDEDRIVICWPIKAEVLSGSVTVQDSREIMRVLESLEHCDLDWTEPQNWLDSVKLADDCRKKGLGVPGLVDRMIALAAERHGLKIWTIDKKLARMARHFGFNWNSASN